MGWHKKMVQSLKSKFLWIGKCTRLPKFCKVFHSQNVLHFQILTLKKKKNGFPSQMQAFSITDNDFLERIINVNIAWNKILQCQYVTKRVWNCSVTWAPGQIRQKCYQRYKFLSLLYDFDLFVIPSLSLLYVFRQQWMICILQWQHDGYMCTFLCSWFFCIMTSSIVK